MNLQNYFSMILASMHKSMDAGEMINVWEWWSGVGFYGVIRAHENTGDIRYLELLKKWVEKNIGNRTHGSVNRVISCCGPDYLDSLAGTNVYDNVCKEYEDWALRTAVIAENGGYGHVWGPGRNGIESGKPEYANQLWADSTMMACVFLFRYGLRKNMKLYHKGVEQLKIHLEALYDEEIGLCYHAYDCSCCKTMGQFWGRGNGWVVVALAEMLRLSKGIDIDKTYFEKKFIRIMESAYVRKANNGMLHTVIDHEESYLEESGTLLFGYGMLIGVELGLLDDKFVEWARDIAETIEIDEFGRVKNVSDGTGPHSLEHYLTRPYAFKDYGSGLALMFGTEFLKIM